MRSDHSVSIHRHNRSPVHHQDSVASSLTGRQSSVSVSTCPRSSPKTYAEKVKPKFISTIDEPKYIRLRELAIAEGSFKSISDADLAVLVVHLRECKQEYAAKKELQRADEFTRLAQEARDELAERTCVRDDPSARVAESQAQLNHLREEKEHELQGFDEETCELRFGIMEKQEADWQIFNRHWSEEMPNRYRKSSAQLLQLKQIEKSLTIAGDYGAARDARQRIEAQEKVEVELQQGQLDDDYSAAKRKFESEKAGEIELFERKRSAARVELELSLQRAIERQENRMNVAKNKDPISRKARSDNKIRNVAYGSSFARVAREKNFGIDALLPTLRAPTDRRRVRINSDCTRRGIVVHPPRAYAPVNEAVEPRPVFETQIGKTQFMAEEE